MTYTKKSVLYYKAVFVTVILLLTSCSVFAAANDEKNLTANSYYEYFGDIYYHNDDILGEQDETLQVQPMLSWTREIVDDDGDLGYGIDIDTDSCGRCHISYSYFSGSSSLKYVRQLDNGSWDIQVVEQLHGRVMTSLALDREDQPHIVYFDVIKRCLKYAHQKNTNWQIEIVDDWVGNIDTICSPSIVVDRWGRPHIAYGDPSTQSMMYATKRFAAIPMKMGEDTKLRGKSNQNSIVTSLFPNQWTLETIDSPLHANFYPLPSISIDPTSNHVCVAYAGHSQLRHAVRLGANNWLIDIANPEGGMNPALAVGANGLSAISYANGNDIFDDFILMCARQDTSGEWIIKMLDRNFRSGVDSAITIDSNSHPHVASICYDEDLVAYFYLTPNGWSGSRVSPLGDEYIWGPGMVSIALYDDQPHVAYRMRDGRGTPHRLMHACRV